MAFVGYLMVRIWGLLLAASLVGSAHASIDRGYEWLTSQQDATGSISNSNGIATALQSTHEALKASELVDLNGLNKAAARSFLERHADESTETLSRLLENDVTSSPSGLLIAADLLDRQNGDGGFPDFPGELSSSLDTAFALRALADADVSDQDLRPGVDFLLRSQHEDGGWGRDGSSVYVTSHATEALVAYRDLPGVASAIALSRTFLLAQRLADDV